jgi:hypothetical protein
MRKCWQIKGCPASHYVNCAAYIKDVDCWQIKQGCLCSEVGSCADCYIYKNRIPVGTNDGD